MIISKGRIALLLIAVCMAVCMVLRAQPSYADVAAGGNATYPSEADTFLASMPAGLQGHQTEAIRKAMSGDGGMLQKVRSARNSAAELPSDVSRTAIGARLALFRSNKYDGDTIPLLVYLHGGGWTIGSINSCSRYCAAMAQQGVAVLAVDYRLAPEHPFPAGLNDCVAAVRLALDRKREWKCGSISIGGDSSGGNLAIATALSFPKGTFSTLIAFYPVTKAYPDGSESWRRFGRGFGLDSELMDVFNEAYTTDPHRPLVSPAEATDSMLCALPPTLLVAAERDILRCQGSCFAERLGHLGVESRYVLIPGSVHLFITVPGQPAAFSRAVSESVGFIRCHSGRSEYADCGGSGRLASR